MLQPVAKPLQTASTDRNSHGRSHHRRCCSRRRLRVSLAFRASSGGSPEHGGHHAAGQWHEAAPAPRPRRHSTRSRPSGPDHPAHSPCRPRPADVGGRCSVGKDVLGVRARAAGSCSNDHGSGGRDPSLLFAQDALRLRDELASACPCGQCGAAVAEESSSISFRPFWRSLPVVGCIASICLSYVRVGGDGGNVCVRERGHENEIERERTRARNGTRGNESAGGLEGGIQGERERERKRKRTRKREK